MKQKVITILSAVLITVFLWGCLLLIDIARVGIGQDAGIRPLITVHTEREDKQISYTSLGYTLTYELQEPDELAYPWGFSFLLFGDHFIWGGIS